MGIPEEIVLDERKWPRLDGLVYILTMGFWGVLCQFKGEGFTVNCKNNRTIMFILTSVFGCVVKQA